MTLNNGDNFAAQTTGFSTPPPPAPPPLAPPRADPSPHPRHGTAHGVDDSFIARAFKPIGNVADELADDEKLGTTNQNPTGVSLWDLWREDLRTHDGELFAQGFWAIALHRFGNWRMGVKPRFLRVPLSLVYKMAYKWVEWTCGISLNYPVKVGRRVRIWHHSGMILGARSIGNDVHLRQNTTFGVARRGDNRLLKPIIEDRVDVGAGVVIAGAITIGHDSVIGANAVVLKDVPPYSLVVGIPGKVIKSLDPNAKQPETT